MRQNYRSRETSINKKKIIEKDHFPERDNFMKEDQESIARIEITNEITIMNIEIIHEMIIESTETGRTREIEIITIITTEINVAEIVVVIEPQSAMKGKQRE